MPVNRTLGLTEKAREFSTTTDLLMTLALGFRVLDGSLWLGPGLCNKGLGRGGAWREVTCRLLQVSPHTPLDWMMAWMILLAGCLGSSVAAAGLGPEQRGRYSKDTQGHVCHFYLSCKSNVAQEGRIQRRKQCCTSCNRRRRIYVPTSGISSSPQDSLFFLLPQLSCPFPLEF